MAGSIHLSATLLYNVAPVRNLASFLALAHLFADAVYYQETRPEAI